jgi:O-antigen ligase
VVSIDRAARTLMGVTVLAFLVAGDLSFSSGSSWHLVRLSLLGLAVAAAAIVVVRRPGLLGALRRFPLVFFTAFAALDLIASLLAEHPLPATRYAAGYVAVELLAVAIAVAFTDRTLAFGLLATLVVKIGSSLALVTSSQTWWLDTRFMGVLGSPNPMGAAAGLAYLLIVLYGWYDWRRAASRVALALVGLAATTTLAITQSASAMAATIVTFMVVTPFSGVRKAERKQRMIWAVVAAAMLAPLALVLAGGGAAPPRPATPAQSLGLRSEWWSMLLEVAWRHPWLGYGAGSTPSLGIAGAPPWATSAHNLYLETAVYAGVPAAITMALFVLGTVLAVMKSAARARGAAQIGLAIPMVFYAVLSLAEPVLLNAAPSSLVVPLVVAAACARKTDER